VAQAAGGTRLRRQHLRTQEYGSLRLVVTKNRHGNHEFIVTNDLGADLTTVVLRKGVAGPSRRSFATPSNMRGWRRANAGWTKRWFATSASFFSPSSLCS
jgi:hypothetical protein